MIECTVKFPNRSDVSRQITIHFPTVADLYFEVGAPGNIYRSPVYNLQGIGHIVSLLQFSPLVGVSLSSEIYIGILYINHSRHVFFRFYTQLGFKNIVNLHC